MQKIVVNPEFAHLRPTLSQIPNDFDNMGVLLHKDRNVLRRATLDGTEVVIKSYRKHTLANRMIYKWLRPTKAKRAYDHAFYLLENNINTPKPVAYIECYNAVYLTDSYCITKYAAYPDKLEKILQPPFEPMDDILKAVGGLMHQLHSHDILHKDLSPGNILFKKEGDHYDFTLVDINRVEIRALSIAERLTNFMRLGLYDFLLPTVAREYARLSGYPEDEFVEKMMARKKGFDQYVEKRNSVKAFVKGRTQRSQSTRKAR
jgi:tRNA A-37 threonylcarbamoyl transferase component Bud32